MNAGGVRVAWRVADDGTLHAAVTLARPLGVLAAVIGRTPETFVALLPRLFPFCGHAHALAALQAVEAAQGIDVAPEHLRARTVLAQLDAVAAHVWRAALDWPVLAGTPTHAPSVADARQAVTLAARALYPDGDWMAPGGGRLAPVPHELHRLRDALPPLEALLRDPRLGAAIEQRLADALAGIDTVWQRRVAMRFVQTRTRALADLVAADGALLGALTLACASPRPLQRAEGRGTGSALTARGMLQYTVSIVDGCVASCELSAPIDRDFGPGGEAQRWLAAIDEEAQDPVVAARWMLAALDPCAEVQVAGLPVHA